MVRDKKEKTYRHSLWTVAPTNFISLCVHVCVCMSVCLSRFYGVYYGSDCDKTC